MISEQFYNSLKKLVQQKQRVDAARQKRRFEEMKLEELKAKLYRAVDPTDSTEKVVIEVEGQGFLISFDFLECKIIDIREVTLVRTPPQSNPCREHFEALKGGK